MVIGEAIFEKAVGGFYPAHELALPRLAAPNRASPGPASPRPVRKCLAGRKCLVVGVV